MLFVYIDLHFIHSLNTEAILSGFTPFGQHKTTVKIYSIL